MKFVPASETVERQLFYIEHIATQQRGTLWGRDVFMFGAGIPTCRYSQHETLFRIGQLVRRLDSPSHNRTKKVQVLAWIETKEPIEWKFFRYEMPEIDMAATLLIGTFKS